MKPVLRSVRSALRVRVDRARVDQRGVSMLQTLTGLAIAASLGGIVSMNSAEMVSAAEANTCKYEYTILQTAVDAYSLTSEDLTYPLPAGVDGLDAVRTARLIRKTSVYWRYLGADANRTPQFELQRPVEGCK